MRRTTFQLLTESLVALGEAARRFPPGRSGRSVSFSCVLRWVTDGILGPDGQWRGIEAVIDKDYAAALLATRLNADLFVILTGVAKVAVDRAVAPVEPDQRPGQDDTLGHEVHVVQEPYQRRPDHRLLDVALDVYVQGPFEMDDPVRVAGGSSGIARARIASEFASAPTSRLPAQRRIHSRPYPTTSKSLSSLTRLPSCCERSIIW